MPFIRRQAKCLQVIRDINIKGAEIFRDIVTVGNKLYSNPWPASSVAFSKFESDQDLSKTNIYVVMLRDNTISNRYTLHQWIHRAADVKLEHQYLHAFDMLDTVFRAYDELVFEYFQKDYAENYYFQSFLRYLFSKNSESEQAFFPGAMKFIEENNNNSGIINEVPRK